MQGERGTMVWAFQQFRSDALTQILNDLSARETRGVSKPVCDTIQKSLALIVNEATGIVEAGFFSKPLYLELQKFEEEYRRWNGPEEDTSVAACAHRIQCIKQMRKYRQRAAKKTQRDLRKLRKDQYVLSHQLDLQAISGMYEAFRKICESAPEIFVCLGRAVKRYVDRKDGH